MLKYADGLASLLIVQFISANVQHVVDLSCIKAPTSRRYAFQALPMPTTEITRISANSQEKGTGACK